MDGLVNEYSFLEGVINAGEMLHDYCGTSGFEKYYNHFLMPRGLINERLRDVVKNVFGKIADTLNPNASRKDYYQRLNLEESISSTLEKLGGMKLLDEGIKLAELLQKTYKQPGKIDYESYNAGNACVTGILKQKLNDLAKPGLLLSIVKRIIPSIRNITNVMSNTIDEISGLKKNILEPIIYVEPAVELNK